MSVHVIDSEIYGSVWGTEEMHTIFDEVPRTQGWIEIICSLAEAQSEVDIIPHEAVEEIRRVCNINKLDMDLLRKRFNQSGHSMHGLIQELKKMCKGSSGEWIYYGATVQDITDTWISIALLKVWGIVFRDLRKIEHELLVLAKKHRTTPMLGRTHGQPGSPITFGFKVAIWVREIHRHIERLKDIHKRMGVGQLAGGVGSLSAFAERGIQLQSIFFKKLGLRIPDISWISSRDSQAEFIQLLSMISSTLDKIGHEVYTLQRPEINELNEIFKKDAIGSITMPHKRNPELSEHLGTLARLIRHNTNCLNENLVHEHERDGRSWKSEWGLIGPICVMIGAQLQLGYVLCSTLQVNSENMMMNLKSTKGHIYSEGIMLALARKIGKQTAHDLVYKISKTANKENRSLKSCLVNNEKVMKHLTIDDIEVIFDYKNQLGLCPEFVDKVVNLSRKSRAGDKRFLIDYFSNE